jgi:hypothetical protein
MSCNSGVTVRVPVVSSVLNGDDSVSVGSRSDSLSSPVEDPPLSNVVWVVVVDSQSVLVMTNMLMPDDSSFGWHNGLDLESNTIVEWVSWVVDSLSVQEPSLVVTIVASEPDGVSVVGVGVSMHIEAQSSSVSDVSGVTWEE